VIDSDFKFVWMEMYFMTAYSGADMANLCREAALGPIKSLASADIENITADEVG